MSILGNLNLHGEQFNSPSKSSVAVDSNSPVKGQNVFNNDMLKNPEEDNDDSGFSFKLAKVPEKSVAPAMDKIVSEQQDFDKFIEEQRIQLPIKICAAVTESERVQILDEFFKLIETQKKRLNSKKSPVKK